MRILQLARINFSQPFHDVIGLFKPRLSLLVLLTTAVGMQLAGPKTTAWRMLLPSLLATLAVVAGANGLNSYLERNIDAQMHRTSRRPLPQGRITPQSALLLSLLVAASGVGFNYWLAFPLTALLSFVALMLYAVVYTPMKQLSPWAVVVGALPGAMPPLLGCSAVHGNLTNGAWALFVLMAVWQIPHSLAIATYLCDDYRRGGIRVLPWVAGTRCAIDAIVASSWLLVPLSVLPWLLRATSWHFVPLAVAASIGFAWHATQGLWTKQPLLWAKAVFYRSLWLLCLLLILLIITQQQPLAAKINFKGEVWDQRLQHQQNKW